MADDAEIEKKDIFVDTIMKLDHMFRRTESILIPVPATKI